MQPDISFLKVALCKLLSWAWTRVWRRLKSVRSRRGFWSTTSWCTSNSTICTLFATGFVRFFVLSILLANYTLWTALLAASFSLMVLKVVLNHHGKRFQVGCLFENVFFVLSVLSFANADQEERFDPMVYVFPRVTKCTFHKFGSSGTISRHDSMCVLSQNIINEKTYIFLWFWFIIMATLLALLIVYRYITLSSDHKIVVNLIINLA